MRGKMRESRYCQWKVVAAAVAVVSEVTTVQVRSGKKFTLFITKWAIPGLFFIFVFSNKVCSFYNK